MEAGRLVKKLYKYFNWTVSVLKEEGACRDKKGI